MPRDLITSVNDCIYELNTNNKQTIQNLYGSIRKRQNSVLKTNRNMYNK